MRVSDFDFELPTELIALRPAIPRDSARLLVVGADGRLDDRGVGDLPDLLRAGDILVFNDTKVIPARLSGERDRGGLTVPVQATLLQRLSPHRWTALMKPGKRLKVGDTVRFEAPFPPGGGRVGDGGDTRSGYGAAEQASADGAPLPLPPQQGEGTLNSDDERLTAIIESKGEDGAVTLAFDLAGPALDAEVMRVGVMPLPPYIAALRPEDAQDLSDYQTVYAKEDGSVAAPTAGLHFTPALLDALAARGIGRAFVTLHVGAGTFLPMKVEAVADHRMHAETGEISRETADALNAARAAGGRIVCVGTTSARLLESATDERGVVRPFTGETAIFITPGYTFRAADVLMTNFHLPKSTLIMLVSAFVGMDRTRAAYAHAIAGRYRFYSYGDAGLWFRSAP